MDKQERIKYLKYLIAKYIRERNYYKIDRCKFLLKQAKKL